MELIDNIIASVYQENSPEGIYFLMLYNIFNEFLDDINEDVLPNGCLPPVQQGNSRRPQDAGVLRPAWQDNRAGQHHCRAGRIRTDHLPRDSGGRMSQPTHPAFISYPKQATFGRNLPKNKIYEHSDANTRLKELFVEQVEQIVWPYKLAPETINLPARPGVPEIQIFSVQLKSTELHEDIQPQGRDQCDLAATENRT